MKNNFENFKKRNSFNIDDTFFKLLIIDKDNNIVIIDFYSFNDAIVFAEDVISKCSTLKGITSIYEKIIT